MPYIDGQFETPVFQSERRLFPIEGTMDTMWEETYIQLREHYEPLPLMSESARHSSHFLIEQPAPEEVGPVNSALLRFTLLFSAVPAQRIERQVIAYTFPGRSRGTGSRWRRYGWRSPSTKQVAATITFSYFISATGNYTPLQQTVPTIEGGPVDFFGAMYEPDEPWESLGSTDPASEPMEYVVSDTATRWRAQIWERVVIKVNRFGF